MQYRRDKVFFTEFHQLIGGWIFVLEHSSPHSPPGSSAAMTTRP